MDGSRRAEVGREENTTERAVSEQQLMSLYMSTWCIVHVHVRTYIL